MLNNQDLEIIKKYFSENSCYKLQLGCGGNYLDGWLNTDIVSLGEPFVYLDLTKKYYFKENTFDYIFSEHTIEHLSFSEALNMLNECFRVLKSNGKLRIATPDLLFLINLYRQNKSILQNEYIKWSTNNFLPDVADFFGEEEFLDVFVINNFFREWGHKLIHDFKSLSLIMRKIGFTNISREKVSISSDPNFIDLERHGKIIPGKFNWLETMVVEAVKP